LCAKIAANRHSPRPLSLYFHIPFCQTLCWYCGCNTVITKNQSASGRYVGYLGRQVRHIADLGGNGRMVEQIHLGGGTPTFLAPDEIRELGAMIRDNFHVSADAEMSVEIDPRRLTRQHVSALRDAGMNRASIGVQDLDASVQAAVNRIQPFEQRPRWSAGSAMAASVRSQST